LIVARVERRVVAVPAEDIVGYSHLMDADEKDTLAQLSE
jgi:class 3 adenylate cyclase